MEWANSYINGKKQTTYPLSRYGATFVRGRYNGRSAARSFNLGDLQRRWGKSARCPSYAELRGILSCKNYIRAHPNGIAYATTQPVSPSMKPNRLSSTPISARNPIRIGHISAINLILRPDPSNGINDVTPIKGLTSNNTQFDADGEIFTLD